MYKHNIIFLSEKLQQNKLENNVDLMHTQNQVLLQPIAILVITCNLSVLSK